MFFFLQLGMKEGGKGGWMDRWMEGSIIPYHIRVFLLDWIELNWYHPLAFILKYAGMALIPRFGFLGGGVSDCVVL